jgi:cycloartenol synthase
MKGLLAAGRSYETSASIRSACDFLLSKQHASGGWGESYLSCQDKVVSKELLLFLVLKVLTSRMFFCLD